MFIIVIIITTTSIVSYASRTAHKNTQMHTWIKEIQLYVDISSK